MPGMRLYGERNIVERGEVKKQRRDLERAGKAKGAALMDRQGRDIAAGEMDAPGVGRDLTRELPDQRALAGAIRPDDGVQLARLYRQRDGVGSHDATKALGQAIDVEQPVSHGACPPRAR